LALKRDAGRSAYIVGVDTGGTFTDCAILDAEGRVTCDKALTTPGDLTEGLVEALANAGRRIGLGVEDLLGNTRFVAHGTTQGLNRLYTRSGARVGLLTTRGHEDALFIGRVFQKVAGLGEREVTAASTLRKPAPLVPRDRVLGITERIDCDGDVVVALNEAELDAAIEHIVATGVESVAVVLLWSFMNSAHEQQVKAKIRAKAPGLFVTVSSDLSPVLGEYERTATTVINAYLAPTTHRYLQDLEARLRGRHLQGPVLVMQSNGGILPAAAASERAVQMVASGPVGGVTGAALLARALDLTHVITTDVGGTSFDVGMVIDAEPILASQPNLGQYTVQIPMIDVRSIGAGGGSLAWVEEGSGLLRVGPQSAGANPGPVCYGRGGQQPTVTDANLTLGRLDAGRFFGGRMTLDAAAAEKAIRTRIAEPLGLTVVQAAQGILDIVDAHMSDLVHKMTIEGGWDPRDFVLFAFGGGGPLHVGSYAEDLQVRHALISPYAPMFSALGMASAGITRYYIQARPSPFPPAERGVKDVFDELEQRARRDADESAGVADGSLSLKRFVDMRFRFQVHELRVPAPSGSLDAASITGLRTAFEAAYERTYGAGTVLPGAAIEIVNYGLTSYVPVAQPPLQRFEMSSSDPREAALDKRTVYFRDRFHVTPVYTAERLRPGNVVAGPALIEDLATTTVVHPGQRIEVDCYRNLLLNFER
jgi:N-methylhydantoinase A